MAVFSGSAFVVAREHPGFDKMIAAAHRGRYGVLVVWSLDRLHRGMVGALQIVLELDRLGVQVVSVREPWLDTGGLVAIIAQKPGAGAAPDFRALSAPGAGSARQPPPGQGRHRPSP